MAAARDDINIGYLQKFSTSSDVLRGEIGVAGDVTVARALERLELTLSRVRGSGPGTAWVTATPCSWRLSCLCSATVDDHVTPQG
ncbi:hypothetical protein OG604_43210 [Streptomyces sp. NBC_01231]|nr:hypothetical protein OG604_43210 [Streptomyces sp. NBC_01231]